MSTSVSFDPTLDNADMVTADQDARRSRVAEPPRAAVVHELDPLTDARWPEFVARHPQSSIFHTRAWLEALRKTYGYRPVVYTTSTGTSLENGVAFCKVESVLTGKRLVSLPFSDHCQPLASGGALQAILSHVERQRKQKRLRYVELRPLIWKDEDQDPVAFSESNKTSFQTIDLTPELNTIYRKFHDSCIRRKIKRAEKENLVYESGRSDVLLEKFRTLLLLTRRRHKLPPQPAAWFENLVQCLGSQIEIHLVSKGDAPAASIITLRHKNQVTYKYGCSDGQFNNLGGTPLLFWKVVQQARESGAVEFDLGRSDYSDPGLIAFKEHLGATSTELRYYRNPPATLKPETTAERHAWARNTFARLPDAVLEATGKLLYKHLG